MEFGLPKLEAKAKHNSHQVWEPISFSGPTIPETRFEPAIPTSDSPQVPYRDIEDDEGNEESPADANNGPPPYEPIYDYLRHYHIPQYTIFPPPDPFYQDLSNQNYSERPFFVHISDPESSSLPLLDDTQLQDELGLGIIDDDNYNDPETAEERLEIEEFVKWVIIMMTVSFTIASVGTAFDWGRP